MELPFAILVWHLIYGVFLGRLWNPTDGDQAAADAIGESARRLDQVSS